MGDSLFSTKTRQLLYKRSRGVCEGCLLRNLTYQLHHRRPRGMGGSSESESGSPANGLHLCGGCHALTESQRAWGLENGWLVRQQTDPATVPVFLGGEWFLLDDEGGKKQWKDASSG